jgi:uncharacterized damage-inducible protein DinB
MDRNRGNFMQTNDQTKPRLSPDEFKNEIGRRGWSVRALARRWDVSESWVHRLARNTERALHWDDAVRGLPTLASSDSPGNRKLGKASQRDDM